MQHIAKYATHCLFLDFYIQITECLLTCNRSSIVTLANYNCMFQVVEEMSISKPRYVWLCFVYP